MNTAQWKMESLIGPLYLVASPKGLQGIFWQHQDAPLVTSLKSAAEEVKVLAQAARELEEYFAGERKEFTVPLDVKGTPFQERVWAELRKIPYAQTSSYGEIATRIKNKKASRAVGTANGRNPLSIIVPCHRVIAGDGTLGGYAGGLTIKTKLLRLEKNHSLS